MNIFKNCNDQPRYSIQRNQFLKCWYSTQPLSDFEKTRAFALQVDDYFSKYDPSSKTGLDNYQLESLYKNWDKNFKVAPMVAKNTFESCDFKPKDKFLSKNEVLLCIYNHSKLTSAEKKLMMQLTELNYDKVDLNQNGLDYNEF